MKIQKSKGYVFIQHIVFKMKVTNGSPQNCSFNIHYDRFRFSLSTYQSNSERCENENSFDVTFQKRKDIKRPPFIRDNIFLLINNENSERPYYAKNRTRLSCGYFKIHCAEQTTSERKVNSTRKKRVQRN